MKHASEHGDCSFRQYANTQVPICRHTVPTKNLGDYMFLRYRQAMAPPPSLKLLYEANTSKLYGKSDPYVESHIQQYMGTKDPACLSNLNGIN